LAIKNLNGFVVCNSFCLMFMCFWIFEKWPNLYILFF
jgi:hypothetical protein